MSQEVRDAVGTQLLSLTLKELFLWRYMQTDPNWWARQGGRGSGACTLLCSKGRRNSHAFPRLPSPPALRRRPLLPPGTSKLPGQLSMPAHAPFPPALQGELLVRPGQRDHQLD